MLLSANEYRGYDPENFLKLYRVRKNRSLIKLYDRDHLCDVNSSTLSGIFYRMETIAYSKHGMRSDTAFSDTCLQQLQCQSSIIHSQNWPYHSNHLSSGGIQLSNSLLSRISESERSRGRIFVQG